MCAMCGCTSAIPVFCLANSGAKPCCRGMGYAAYPYAAYYLSTSTSPLESSIRGLRGKRRFRVAVPTGTARSGSHPLLDECCCVPVGQCRAPCVAASPCQASKHWHEARNAPRRLAASAAAAQHTSAAAAMFQWGDGRGRIRPRNAGQAIQGDGSIRFARWVEGHTSYETNKPPKADDIWNVTLIVA